MRAIGWSPKPGAFESGRAADGDAYRRKHREIEIAVERELPARRVLDRGRDVVFVVVRIEKQADRYAGDDEQHDDHAEDQPENLE
jgi:hypothetical protein